MRLHKAFRRCAPRFVWRAAAKSLFYFARSLEVYDSSDHTSPLTALVLALRSLLGRLVLYTPSFFRAEPRRRDIFCRSAAH